MKSTKKLPFTIIKTPIKKVTQNGSIKTSLNAKPTQNLTQKDLIGKRMFEEDGNGQDMSPQLSYVTAFSIFNKSNNVLPEMLQKYTEASNNYCEDGFTNRAETLLTRIALSKNIPQEVKSNFPLQNILMTICKIFMLNENEIILLACALDRCGWKVDQVVFLEESEFLIEFPNMIVGAINRDYKRLIIYLMIITSSIKQELNPQEDFDYIQVYCESLCSNFSSLVNRRNRILSNLKSNYTLMEINLKFRELNQHDFLNNSSNINYNTLADSIISLSGCYKSKIEPEDAVSVIKESVFDNITAKMLHSPSNSASTFLETVEHKSMFNEVTPITSLQNLEADNYFPKFDKTQYIQASDLSTLDEIEQRKSSLDTMGTLREEFGMTTKQMRLNNGRSLFVEPKEALLVKQVSGNNNFFNSFDMDDYFSNSVINDKVVFNSGYNQLIAEEAPYLMKFSNSWYQD